MRDQQLQKARFLFDQHRYSDAEPILGALMAQDPSDTEVIALLAEIRIQLDDYDEALRLIDLGLNADASIEYFFYLRAKVYLYTQQGDKAVFWIEKAIEMDPVYAAYHAFKAYIQLHRKNFQEALDAANHALSLEPENLLALNTRSSCLLKLNNPEDAFETIEGALREDPNNAYTHANYGWTLLEHGDTNKALEHFREALRNDPNFELAQSGMAEALKARFPVYKWYMNFQFWLGNLSSKYQWFVILGIYFGQKLIRAAGAISPALQPFTTPLLILIMIFVFGSWIITPIGNLVLRFNEYGKFLLSKEESISSLFCGAALLLALLSGITSFILPQPWWITLSLVAFTMVIPLGGMFNKARWPHTMLVICIGLGVLGAMAVITEMQGTDLENPWITLYGFGLLAYQFLHNYLIINRGNFH